MPSPAPTAALPLPYGKGESAAAHARLRAMVDSHYDAVWRALRRFGVPSPEADDAAQRVFLVASRRIQEIEPQGERAYLMGIAIRTASDTRRTLRRRREEAPTEGGEWIDPAPSPEHLVDRRRACARLDAILGAMPFEQRTVFVLHELEGLTLPEIAASQSIPLGTATSRLRRARETFRERCADGI